MRRAVVIFTAGLMGCVSTTWAAEAKDSVREPVAKPSAAIETPVKTDLFVAGEDGYATYRIPGIVVTQRGTILAYCAARKDGIGDWADIDIALRRSLDGGHSWLPRQILVDAGKATADNPTAIVDRKTGAVHFLYQVNYCFYERGGVKSQMFHTQYLTVARFPVSWLDVSPR